MSVAASKTVKPADRAAVLTSSRNLKMARSAHAYVRGNTRQFYEWLQAQAPESLPAGPAIWICGDCHLGNLGPIADMNGGVEIQIRDLDQTVIGNPAHDLIRLGLSLAMAARGSDLPGVTTAVMLEQLMEGYCAGLAGTANEQAAALPAPVHLVMKDALRRSWKHLARDRFDAVVPTVPIGKRFWKLAPDEKDAIARLFEKTSVSRLATLLGSRDDDGAGDGDGRRLLDEGLQLAGPAALRGGAGRGRPGGRRPAVLPRRHQGGRARGGAGLHGCAHAQGSRACAWWTARATCRRTWATACWPPTCWASRCSCASCCRRT